MLECADRVTPLMGSKHVCFEHAVLGEEVCPILTVMRIRIVAIKASQPLNLFEVGQILNLLLKLGRRRGALLLDPPLNRFAAP